MSIEGIVGVWLMLIGAAVAMGVGCAAAAAVLAWGSGRLWRQIWVGRQMEDFACALRYWDAAGRPRLPCEPASAKHPAGDVVQPGRGADD